MADREHEPRASRPKSSRKYGFAAASQPLLPWTYAVKRLEEARNFWLATAGPDGRPQVTPVWAIWVDDALYWYGYVTARWARHLAQNPAIAVHLESGDEVLILEGDAEQITVDPASAAHIIAVWDAKYRQFQPDPEGEGFYRLRPRTARAWTSNTLQDATRWDFERTLE